jgi:hypothetical protein
VASCGEEFELKALSQPIVFFCAREIDDGGGAARIGRRSPLITRFTVCGFGLRPTVLESDGKEITRNETPAVTTATHLIVLRIASSTSRQREQNSQTGCAFHTHEAGIYCRLYSQAKTVIWFQKDQVVADVQYWFTAASRISPLFGRISM